MTCLEKFIADHPDWDEEHIHDCITADCPDDYGYLSRPAWCRGGGIGCKVCWDREIPEEVTIYRKETLAEDDVIAPADVDVFTMFANAQADMEKDMDEVINGLFVGDERLEHPDTDIRHEDAPGISREVTKLINIAEKIMSKIDAPKIICISGKAQHGKDTTAGVLKNYLEADGYKVLITHYGDLVKYICKTFFGWDGNKDEAGRAILQRVGTDVIRAQCPNYWVDFVVGILKMFRDEWDYILIPDCRFPNEIDILKEAKFDVTHVRVIRAPFVSPLTPEQQMHISETALDGVRADIYLTNFGSLCKLTDDIKNDLIPLISFKEESKCLYSMMNI